MGKIDGLAKLTNSYGKITIAALDHRGSLKESLHPENPENTCGEEILLWKRRMVDLYKDIVAGILIDPIYGKEVIEPRGNNGWMLSMEETGYRGDKQARVTTILPDWSVKKAKEMGACSVKLLLYFDPDNVELANAQKGVAIKIAKECKEEDIVFLLEPLSYKPAESKENVVVAIAQALKDIEADIFKFEYPGSAAACRKISEIITKPWVLLSAGMEYAKYKHALKTAMENGASGFAVGRAVWQEFGQYQGELREKYFRETARERMQELVDIVNKSQSSDRSPRITQGSELNQIKAISQAQVEGKRVIVRVDWNVTLGHAHKIVDDTRIVRTLPTIEYLLKHNAKQIILMSHLGKAEEKRSIAPVAEYASELIGMPITLIKDSQKDLQSKKIIMLENLRLWEGEDKNEEMFARQLAQYGDIYVNEAFGECHRESASIVGIPKILPSYAGLWLLDEIETIGQLQNKPERPYVVVMGGAKVDDKIKLIEKLSQSADTILLGGKLANEYLQRKVKVSGKAKIMTPSEGGELLDIGAKTIAEYSQIIKAAKTIVWNGPMGKIEDSRYRKGTKAIYEALVANISAYTVVGGGDTLAMVGKDEHLNRIDHVSTGGGAMLKLLETGTLIGIQALKLMKL